MPYPVECLLEVNEDVIEVLLVLEVLLAQYPKVEDLLCCAASWSEVDVTTSYIYNAYCPGSVLRRRLYLPQPCRHLAA